MLRPATDRSLRRLVLRLASASDEDVEDVLSRLDIAQAAKVRALLAEYAADSAPASSAALSPIAPQRAPAEAGPSFDGLSTWIVERMITQPGGLRVTGAALRALRETVIELQPPASPAPVALEKPPGPVGWRRFASLLLRPTVQS